MVDGGWWLVDGGWWLVAVAVVVSRRRVHGETEIAGVWSWPWRARWNRHGRAVVGDPQIAAAAAISGTLTGGCMTSRPSCTWARSCSNVLTFDLMALYASLLPLLLGVRVRLPLQSTVLSRPCDGCSCPAPLARFVSLVSLVSLSAKAVPLPMMGEPLPFIPPGADLMTMVCEPPRGPGSDGRVTPVRSWAASAPASTPIITPLPAPSLAPAPTSTAAGALEASAIPPRISLGWNDEGVTR